MDINVEIEDVLLNHPSLNYDTEKNHLEGELFISDNDSYELIIDLNSYPKSFPIVYETGERIPKKMDRHIYTDTGSCCFTTRAKAQILLRTKVKSLLIFINNIVIPYLQNNSYFEINKKYKTAEYSHGPLGAVESYRDILDLEIDMLIAQLIYRRVKGEKLSIRDACYCGSGIPLKKCNKGKHDKCYRAFRKIDKEILEGDLYTDFSKHLNL